MDAAAAEYRAFLAQQPDDGVAQAALGAVYVQQKRYRDAVAAFREAARLQPGDADIWSNLGTGLAITGDLPGAISAFERALEIDPNAETARRNLSRAKAQLAR